MPVEAVLISSSVPDFNSFLSAAYQALDRNVASAADASYRELKDTEKFLYCLAGLREDSSEVITADLLSHVTFSILVIANEYDFLHILERTLGMPFVVTETTASGVDVAVLTGTLAQWKLAVASGTSKNAPPIIRNCFSKILLLFDRAGLTSVWQDDDRTTARDRSGLLLEDRRR